MTKAEIKTLGDAVDDTAEIINYGKTDIDFTMHPDQVQPAHIVIQRLGKFRSDERVFGRGRQSYKILTSDQRTELCKLFDNGSTTKQLGKMFGIPQSSCYRILKEAVL